MQIKYTVYNEHNNHKGKEVTISNNEIITKTEMNDLAIKLIRNNITESLEFHIKNLNTNGVNYSYNKIKNLLQMVRESDLPNNEEILYDISKTKTIFNDNQKHDEGLPFCISKGKFVNIRYKNRLEKYIIFTSLYQLKMASDCDDFF